MLRSGKCGILQLLQQNLGGWLLLLLLLCF